MDPAALLDRITAAGIQLGIDARGDGLTVESRAPLTQEQRRCLRDNKVELLAHLRAAADQQPALPPDLVERIQRAAHRITLDALHWYRHDGADLADFTADELTWLVGDYLLHRHAQRTNARTDHAPEDES